MGKWENNLKGQRILITGGARGLGAALARALTAHGASVALLGIETDLLEKVAADCAAPWRECDVTDAAAVDTSIAELVGELGGLDAVIANAGVAAQLPLIGGNPDVFLRTVDVNIVGVYNTIRSAGPHVCHDRGYVLLISSLAAAIHLPLLGAYSASKAAVEALGDALRAELRPHGGAVGVAYFGELDTDMTARGFGTRAAAELVKNVPMLKVARVEPAIRALERGIAKRSRIIVSPRYTGPILHSRAVAQRIMEIAMRRNAAAALEIARAENAPLTTIQPEHPRKNRTGGAAS
ncbi:SDR family NAD(P)-dependent oxidoreductase [Hoyosella sp. G463]|uniref:SDR family NAD(P)-dependent oxidoreductase n=1 Tax=Lolliginicoccus lacisalsi TaxID=2742202 RepID=A0A927PM34_9ACTN|nr:SDR family NAD(P)-dependent oxidoreductase [Lolliginicoccus lacisalsi]MBD8505971.1 SDR family NAD(P)-dependent oxidoreductase [Lolliginicoccus lacisalsi]